MTDRPLSPGFLWGVDRRPPERGRQRRQRHLVPRERDADGLPGPFGQGRERLGAVGVRPRPRRRAWASTPTASRSSGRASSPSRASSRRRRSTHYEAIVDGCLARGLAPIVTFNHFTSPHWFAARGAWLDAEAPELFARYCGVVMDRFGDRIASPSRSTSPTCPRC